MTGPVIAMGYSRGRSLGRRRYGALPEMIISFEGRRGTA
jgi:hypothetical protein